jgi:hypothetical protein
VFNPLYKGMRQYEQEAMEEDGGSVNGPGQSAIFNTQSVVNCISWIESRVCHVLSTRNACEVEAISKSRDKIGWHQNVSVPPLQGPQPVLPVAVAPA